MPQPNDVRIWTAWGAQIAFKDERQWDQQQATEHQQDGWFYPQQITDSQGTTWISSVSRDSATLSYTTSVQSIRDYHITFSRDSLASCFVLHETIQGQHKSNVTYEVQKKLDSQLQIKNGLPTPTVKQQHLVESIF